MKIHFFGADGFSVRCLEALRGHRVTVVSRPLKPSGRGQRRIVDTPLVAWAKTAGLELKYAESPGDFTRLLGDKPDMAVAVSYGKLIPEEYLSKLPFGGLNVHPSLLPALKGAAPLHRAIMQQLPYTGVSVQTLDPLKFDNGQVLWQSKQVPVGEKTLIELSSELAGLGAQGLAEVVDNWGHGHEPIIPTQPSSWAKLIQKHEHKINPQATVAQTLAQARALTKLYFEHPARGKPSRTLVWDLVECEPTGAPAPRIHDSRLIIPLKDGAVAANAVQAAGYPPENPHHTSDN